MNAVFPVIDLFAGPGGLGEGFAAFSRKGVPGFEVRLSIEKDDFAYETLLLRKFFRAFGRTPREYHRYLKGRLTRDELFRLNDEQYQMAFRQTWKAELGKEDRKAVSERIDQALDGTRMWALIGGPPCQAYSLVGRSRMQSRTNPAFENDHRHFLYREYLRIVAEHGPAVFLMENVKGLLSATHGGEKIFSRILSDLREPREALKIVGRDRLCYRLYPVCRHAEDPVLPTLDPILAPGSFLVRAEDHGIPQARHRLFVLGVREDLEVVPRSLRTSRPVAVAEVISDLPRLRSRLSRGEDSAAAWLDAVANVRTQRWYRDSHDVALRDAASAAVAALSAVGPRALDSGEPWLRFSGRPGRLASWYREKCRGISNHEARGHMVSDLHRYLFASSYAIAHGRSPTLREFPSELMPEHRNADRGRRGEMFGDRFRVQVPKRASSTITSHISKDGNYFIHFDPTQCRSLTVREAARLQTFPDSYHFEGPRTEQYHQVGNAVPPLLAKQVASIVHDVLTRCTRV